MNKEYYELHKESLPLIPLRGITIFPFMVIHFDAGREKSINALEKAMLDESLVLLCTQIDPKVEDPKREDIHEIGTISKVKQMLKLPGGGTRVLVEGLNRAKISNITSEKPYIEAEVDEYKYDGTMVNIDKDMEAAMRLVVSDLDEYINLNDKISSEVLMAISDIEDPGRLVDIIASYIVLKTEDNQKILDTFDLHERLEALHGILKKEIELLKIEEEIDERVKSQINKVQKDHYLREQMKAIQEELGDGSKSKKDSENYKKKIKSFSFQKRQKKNY